MLINGTLATSGISIAGGAIFDVSAQTTPTLAANQNQLLFSRSPNRSFAPHAHQPGKAIS